MKKNANSMIEILLSLLLLIDRLSYSIHRYGL